MFLMMMLAAFPAAPQAEIRMHCSSPGSVVSCRGDDGSTYIERQVGARRIRQGTDAAGHRWTEWINEESDGTRTLGEDDRGRTWARSCRQGFGTRGTDRQGNQVYVPPRPAPMKTVPRLSGSDEAQAYADCTGAEGG